ncbi:MAG: hypothetical protein CSA13_01120 [Clostridiales bacterium]|nr:MAG: hypothetical protein CSA13_01120 [Clostridiales bacterium]
MKLPIGNEMALCAVKYRTGARCEMSATYENIKSNALTQLSPAPKKACAKTSLAPGKTQAF